MVYFQVRYDSRVVNYDRIGFIRLATGGHKPSSCILDLEKMYQLWASIFPVANLIKPLRLQFTTLESYLT